MRSLGQVILGIGGNCESGDGLVNVNDAADTDDDADDEDADEDDSDNAAFKRECDWATRLF